jgi:hypothetical protein
MAYAGMKLLPESQMAAYEGQAEAGSGATVWGQILVKVGADGRMDDHFVAKLCGSQRLNARFEGRELLRAATLARFSFALERRPSEITFKNNSFTTKWEDLEQLVASSKITALEGEDQEADQAFREAWAAAKEANESLGAAVRWSLQAHPAYGFKLVLQGMPGTARSLRRDARLTADTASCIQLASWTVAASMGAEGQWNGPAPTIFAADLPAAGANIRAHPERFSAGL